MITEYQIKNFKCFADTGRIRLGAINVLLGRNNSGKSSLIQPLQMLAQTLDLDDPTVALATHEPHDFGGYFEWVHRSLVTRDFECGFSFGPVTIAHAGRASKETRKPARLSLNLRFGLSSRASTRGRLHLKALDLDVSLGTRKGPNVNDQMAWRIELDPVRKPIKGSFNGAEIDLGRFELTNFLPKNLKWDKPVSLFVSNYCVVQTPHYFYSMDIPMRAALDIAAVEPMRPAIPRVLRSNDRYPHRSDSTTDILAGLFRSRLRRPKQWTEFQEYVNQWFGKEAQCFADFDIEIVDDRRELFALVGKDIKTGARVNLADMGFGIAQAFPIFVRLFFSKEGQIVIIEEPELHLNPAAQGMIFDAVLEKATQGRQIIVETHSEHFVLRLRRRSLEQAGLREVVRVYYVERGKKESTVTELPLTEDGRLDNWPVGFLDEAFAESVAILKESEKQGAKRR